MNPKLVIFNGHGTTTSIHGHKDNPIIVMNDNEHLLKSRITYAISCNVAAKLGKKIILNGNEGTAFIGYEGPFSFVRDASRECTPMKDKFSEPFKRISNEVIISLLKGKSIKEAYEKSQQLCTKLIIEYSASESEKSYKEIRFWLFWDKTFQKYLGDGNAAFI